ncbi:MAG: hypothetical protein MAG453_00042 [Calditrichaeota bacterium]|nr:hypothetical protein [Calditrichota bacterium]
MDWAAIASRLETLRRQAGINKSKLAGAVGYTPSMITRILTGERGIGPTGLVNFARFFDVPLSTIVEGPLPKDEVLLHFRDEDRTIFPDTLYPRAKGHAYRFADTYRLLLGTPVRLRRARPTIEDPIKRGKKAAESLRNLRNLQSGRISSIVEFITGLGIAVAEVDDNTLRLRGVAFRWEDGVELIAVERELRTASKRLLLAHELGHLVMEDLKGTIERRKKRGQGDSFDLFAPDPFERAANSFAACLLLPDDDLTPFVRGHDVLKAGNPVDVWHEEIAHLSREYGVSAELVYWRLCQAGMYSQALAREHKRKLYSHPCSRVELDTVFLESEDCTRLTVTGIQPSIRYMNWVRILTGRNSISAAEAAHLLGPTQEAA